MHAFDTKLYPLECEGEFLICANVGGTVSLGLLLVCAQHSLQAHYCDTSLLVKLNL